MRSFLAELRNGTVVNLAFTHIFAAKRPAGYRLGFWTRSSRAGAAFAPLSAPVPGVVDVTGVINAAGIEDV